MPSAQDDYYLAVLKDYLKKNRWPGDREKLWRTVRFLKKLDVSADEEERRKLRGLLAETFAVGEEEILAMLPEAEEAMAAIAMDRRPMPVPTGLLRAYMEVTAQQESPQSFHAFALLTCMGAALERRVWLDMTFFKVWPNLSVVLSGPAGGPKKNTAWDMALDAVREVFGDWRCRQIADASPPALVEELAKGNGVGFVFAPEFRMFFPNQQYMEGAVPLITRLLDNPDEFPVARITRRASTLRNVALSMGGGSTLDWLAKLPSDAQGGGFFTRVMIVHEERSKGVRALPKRAVEQAQAAVRKHLTDVDRFGHGQVRLGAGARKWFKEWYETTKGVKGATPRLVLYYNRKQIHLLRLTLLMGLPARVVTEERLEQARQLLDWVEEPLADVYRIIGMSKSGEAVRAVLDMIKALGGRVPYTKLMREMKGMMNARDFKLALDTLKDAGQIKEVDTLPEHVIVLKELSLVE